MHEKLQDWSSQNFNESFRYHLWIKSLRNAFTAAKKKKTKLKGFCTVEISFFTTWKFILEMYANSHSCSLIHRYWSSEWFLFEWVYDLIFRSKNYNQYNNQILWEYETNCQQSCCNITYNGVPCTGLQIDVCTLDYLGRRFIDTDGLLLFTHSARLTSCGCCLTFCLQVAAVLLSVKSEKYNFLLISRNISQFIDIDSICMSLVTMLYHI